MADYSDIFNNAMYGIATPTEEPTIPDSDNFDDNCVGRIESIRFLTGPDYGRYRPHITVVKLNSVNSEHHTDVNHLRMPLYNVYKAKSMVRIDVEDCAASTKPFKSFTIIARGKPIL